MSGTADVRAGATDEAGRGAPACGTWTAPSPTIVDLPTRGLAAAGGGVFEPTGRGAGVTAGGRSETFPDASTSASYVLPASERVFISLSMTIFDGSSILMNLTPIPAGRSAVPWDVSRFHTTRPTPVMTA